jgi:hypothetical protein
MLWVRRLVLGTFAFLLLAKTALYFTYAWFRLPSPLENFHLEAQMVHLAWRVQAGLSLYPDFRNYPYVANVFGPVYFWLVGLIARIANPDLEGLMHLGRGVTFLCGLLGSLAVAAVLRSRGRLAMCVGAGAAASAGPMFTVSALVRSDILAELLGFLGFLLAQRQRKGALAASVVLLALAMLTRQPTGVFALAASASLALSGQKGRAATVLLGSVATAAVLAVLVQLFLEPGLWTGLLLERRTPLSWAQWTTISSRVFKYSPDLLVLTAGGIGGWVIIARESGNPVAVKNSAISFATLGAFLLTASFATCGKIGSDVNYFLSLRLTSGLAAGWLWYEMGRHGSWRLILAAAVVNVALFASLASPLGSVLIAAENAEWSGRFQDARTIYHSTFELAQQSNVRLLTDCGLIALYQRERAAFVDPFLFRMMVETKSIDPRRMRAMLANEEYDALITTSDVRFPSYDDYNFGLPPTVARIAREHYVLRYAAAGLFFYGRRSEAER